VMTLQHQQLQNKQQQNKQQQNLVKLNPQVPPQSDRPYSSHNPVQSQIDVRR
jgi:hypothetical protein